MMLILLKNVGRRLRNWGFEVLEAPKDLAVTVALIAKPSRGLVRSDVDGGRMLLIDEMIPDPTYGAGYPRADRMLRAIIANGWSVSFYPLIASRNEISRMRLAFPEVKVIRSNGHRALARFIRMHSDEFDTALVSRPASAKAFNAICALVPSFLEKTHYIYDAEALLAPREQRRRALMNAPLSATEYQQVFAAELALLQHADTITAVSEADASVFRARTRASVHVVSHRIDPSPGPAVFDDRRDLLFVGRLTGDRLHSPNVDSLMWFLDEVMPVLDVILGTEYRLQVVGLVDSIEIEKRRSDRIVLNGVVDDLSPIYGACRVFIAPTRFAAGIPLKVLEAFGMGIPCVITPLLAEQIGMAVDDGQAALICAEAAEFADACRRLYTESRLWTDVRDRALAKLKADFSGAAFDAGLTAVLQEATTAASVRAAARIKHGDIVERRV